MPQLADLTVTQVASRIGPTSILLQPIGAVEAHGPHLPLATDLIVAAAAVEAAVAAHGARHDLWTLPPIAYSKSNEHAWAPGTVWLTAATMLAMLDDLGRSLATTAARTLVLVNAHGGNTALLQVACRDLRSAYGLGTFLVHPYIDSGLASELGMGIHAGHDETSLLLHLRPDLVDMSLAARNVPEQLAGNEHVRWGGSVSFGWTSDDFGSSGVIGDPTRASAGHGEELFRRIIERFGDQLDEIAAFSERQRKGS